MTSDEIRSTFESKGALPLSHEAVDCQVAVLIEIAAQLADMNANLSLICEEIAIKETR